MSKKTNPILRVLITFVLGCAVLLLVYWLVPVIMHNEVVINWYKIIGGGVLIAILDLVFPSDKRRQNRENFKYKFK